MNIANKTNIQEMGGFYKSETFIFDFYNEGQFGISDQIGNLEVNLRFLNKLIL